MIATVGYMGVFSATLDASPPLQGAVALAASHVLGPWGARSWRWARSSIGLAFVVWIIYGTGGETVGLGSILPVAGVPLYWWMSKD